MKKVLLVLAVVLLVLGVVGFALLRGLNYWPKPVMPADMLCKQGAPKLSKKQASLRILSWNVQFSASRKYHFFYDGGKDVIATKADVDQTVQQLIKVAKQYNPDIILWQEVDLDSTRSARVDQLKALWEALPDYKCRTNAPYFKSRYVPTPGHQHMGRVNMHLVIFSKFQIEKGTRYALPMLKESFVRRAFNLKRAVLSAQIPFQEGGALHLFNTHFSAFSFGDGTLNKQVQAFIDLVKGIDKKGQPWVAAGDLNLLPPGDDPKRLGKDGNYYADKNNPIDPLFKQLQSALSIEEYKKQPDKYNTYIQFGQKKTDRWIDHFFHSKSLKVTQYLVPQEHNNISDHLPIVVDMKFQ